MLRRFARVLRIALLLAGFFWLALWPVSRWFYVGVFAFRIEPAALGGVGAGFASLEFGNDAVSFGLRPIEMSHRFDLDLEVVRLRTGDNWGDPGAGLRPRINEFPDGTGAWIGLPLWLLAFICLAWPVTSFLIARRKRRRGFPVEPANSLACPSAPEKL